MIVVIGAVLGVNLVLLLFVLFLPDFFTATTDYTSSQDSELIRMTISDEMELIDGGVG
jgi:hypothetical protein